MILTAFDQWLETKGWITYHGRHIFIGQEADATKAVDTISAKMNSGSDGATVFHLGESEKAYDLYNIQDRKDMAKALPKEKLFVIASTNNKTVESAKGSSKEVENLRGMFKEKEYFRGTTTGGWKSGDGTKYIDHGILTSDTESHAVMLGGHWDQEAVTEIDNTGPELHAKFINVKTHEETIIAHYLGQMIEKETHEHYAGEFPGKLKTAEEKRWRDFMSRDDEETPDHPEGGAEMLNPDFNVEGHYRVETLNLDEVHKWGDTYSNVKYDTKNPPPMPTLAEHNGKPGTYADIGHAKYDLIDGSHRLAGARKAGLKSVQVVVVDRKLGRHLIGAMYRGFTKGWITERGRHIYIPETGYEAPRGEHLYLEKPEVSSDKRAWRGNIQIGEPTAMGAGSYGFEKTDTGQKDMYVSWFGLNDMYQGKGYGKMAYGELEDSLRKRGVRTAYLFPANDEAKQFWQHVGYHESTKTMRDIYPSVYSPEVSAAGVRLWEKDISTTSKSKEEEVDEPSGENWVTPRPKVTEATEKAFWDFIRPFLKPFVLRSNATADTTVYGIDAANKMQDSAYLVWHTAEDELVCNYCGPLDFKVISSEEFGGFGYPPCHVNCRCTVEPYDGEPDYYHSQPKAYEEANLDRPVRTTRIALSLSPYFLKANGITKGWVTHEGHHIFIPNASTPKFLDQTTFGGTIHEVNISDIEGWKDKGTRIGDEYDQRSINYHRDQITEDKPILAPVVEKMDDGKLRVVDGWHRINAMVGLGFKRTKVEIV